MAKPTIKQLQERIKAQEEVIEQLRNPPNSYSQPKTFRENLLDKLEESESVLKQLATDNECFTKQISENTALVRLHEIKVRQLRYELAQG